MSAGLSRNSRNLPRFEKSTSQYSCVNTSRFVQFRPESDRVTVWCLMFFTLRALLWYSSALISSPRAWPTWSLVWFTQYSMRSIISPCRTACGTENGTRDGIGTGTIGGNRSSREQPRGRMHQELHLYTHNRRVEKEAASPRQGKRRPPVALSSRDVYVRALFSTSIYNHTRSVLI